MTHQSPVNTDRGAQVTLTTTCVWDRACTTERNRKREAGESERVWMCNAVNCSGLSVFGWWYIWSCLVQTGRREGGGLQASTTDFLLGTQLTSLSKQTVSLSLLRAPVWGISTMSGVSVFRRQKLNLLFVETEHSRVCLSQNITTTNILAVTTVFTFFSPDCFAFKKTTH